MKNTIKAIFLIFALLAGTAAAVTDTFTVSGTWTAPVGVTSVDVEVWGGGGAGGGQNLNSDGGGGGGGGAYSKVVGIAVIPGNNYTVTVGSGGAGVAGGTGGQGGDSYFINIATVLAKGGSGGAPSTGTPPAGGAGGAVAAGVGTTKFSGGNGGQGRNHNTGQGGPGGSSAGTAASGTSGPSTWSTVTAAVAPAGGGIGGNGGTSGNNGSAPVSGNGGGGGGSGDGNPRTGGAGAAGKVLISYVMPPAVTTNAASALSTNGATLNGTVSSNGASTAVTFDYGLTTGYGSTATATASPLAANAVNTAVSADVTGLTCGTTYHFRVKGVNSAGTTNGGDLTFTTSACVVCLPPSNIPVGVTVSCQCDNFTRANLNPSTIFGGNWVATTSDATGIVPRIVTQGYLRLTENTGNNAKAATVPGIFPAAGNYVSVEFRQYAYNGSGADGIAVTLSDYSVPAAPGAFGGSLGYAQQTAINGFAGGWIGVALDEYGNYQNPTEGRSGGPGFIVQSVGVRGSGSGTTGYPWLKGTANLTTVAPNVGIDNRTSLTPSLGDYYQVIVDSRGNDGTGGPTLVSVNRDITGVGNAYSPLIPAFDAYAAATAVGYTQAPVPQNWQISFTGSTGGSTNIHEIGSLRICAQAIVPTTGGTPGGFNAIDEVYTRSNVNAVSGHLYTKLAGSAFTVKVAALNAAGSGILTTYAALANKTVTVKLIDDSVGASCNASAAACSACSKPVVATQNVIFALGDTGFKQSGNFTVPAYANLLVQMSDGTTTGCSVDTFAVRPLGIASVTSSNATNTATTGTPVFKAGSDNFSLSATTTAIAGNSGYAGGVLKINANAVQAVSPATVAGVLAGSFAAATSGASSATATGNTFTYSEVGKFNLLGPDFAAARIPGVYDDTWTAVDSGAKNDCVSGTTAAAYSNTKDASGKYGCNFGITGNTGAFGRFVPDHFDTVVTPGMPCPAALTCPTLIVANDQGFVYSGQPFTTQVIARNASGAPTLNYDSAKTWSKAVTLTAWDALGSTTTQNPGGGTLNPSTVPSTAFNLGVATTGTPIYKFPTTPVAPTDIHVRSEDTDNVTSLRGVSSIEGGIKVVSGRVMISNAHGSELLQLPMTAAVQYWNSTNWVTSTTDNATSFDTATDIAASIVKGPLATVSVAGAGVVTVAGGMRTFTLNQPLVTGSADISLNAPNYLLAGSNGAAVNPSKAGRATFGVYKGANEFIYLRENY